MRAELNFNAVVEDYAGLEGRDLIRRVVQNHGRRTALLSSFGAESSVLLHMVSEIAPETPVIFLDTLKLFPETLSYRDQLISELGLRDLRIVQPDESDLIRMDGMGDLHQHNPDTCCHIRKTKPLEKVLAGFDAIISGRKRFHGAARSDLQFVTHENERLKVEPLAAFSALDLAAYMQKHQLPSHPLRLSGYRSIGCAPCTHMGGNDDDPRAGRWVGTEKTECGIHFTANGTLIRKVARETLRT